MCIYLVQSGPFVQTFASSVPVSGGSFSTAATIPSIQTTCRLRAIPAGVDAENDYLGSFSGPIMYTSGYIPTKDGAKTVGFQAFNEFGTGVGLAQDATECGVATIATIIVPQVELRGPGTQQCAFALPSSNLTKTGTSTATAIRVDGKNAYLPNSVYGFLRNGQALTLTQSSITTTVSRNGTTGDMRVTETSRLKRCSGDNTFPPTLVSCPSLADTGVTVATGETGAPGYIYPGHAASFKTASFDKVVTGFGSHPTATVFVRSDIYASSDDNQADTQALTWSRPPAKIQFSHASTSLFAMPYSFNVPANGAAHVAFAESEAPRTADAKTLAAKAVAAL